MKKAPGFYFFQNSGQKMAGFLFFSKGRNLAWFLLVNLAIFENPQNFSRAARAGFYFFQKFPENRSGFLFFSILGGGKNSGFLKRGGFNSNTPVPLCSSFSSPSQQTHFYNLKECRFALVSNLANKMHII